MSASAEMPAMRIEMNEGGAEGDEEEKRGTDEKKEKSFYRTLRLQTKHE